MTTVSGRPETAPDCLTDGGQNIRFEETRSMKDESGAKSKIKFVRIFVLFLVVFTLASTVLVVVNATSMFGGVDAVLSILDTIWAEQPIFLLVGLLIVSYGLFTIVGFLRAMGRAFDKRIHVRVTETGVTVQREGSGHWQSSGVEIPFDAITTVEYLDPDASSTRIELSDVRAQQFFAGRSQNWIRLERANDSAVYIGSDRPVELAETIAQRAPSVGTVEPF